MTLPANKTKIVCTIGPASESQGVIEQMIRAGMNIARLNFSHGDFSSHKKVIETIRNAEKATERHVTIMADLPGPKMRIGQFVQEPIELNSDDTFTLTTEENIGDEDRISVSFAQLPNAVKPGDKLFLNDGLIELKVVKVDEKNVKCRVLVGGELRSRKGLNLPGIDLGISAFTEHDHDCLKFALEQGVDAVSQSFVETAADITTVRKAAEALGYKPFIIAKIERLGTLDHMDSILEATDGIMVARGDLGVEIPIEQIAAVQKELILQAMSLGKPVITATQMLESMTSSRRPTRAEATDVANAILDGADCVMLSGESAMGKYPVDAVDMLAKIAAAIEPHRTHYYLQERLRTYGRDRKVSVPDLIALSVQTTLERSSPATVIIPTLSGATARSITRFRLPVWITSVCPNKAVCQGLQFSYGVYPVHEPEYREDWNVFARQWLEYHGMKERLVVLTEGPSPKHPESNHRMELIDLKRE
jgi:pyruvate kinase